AGQVRILPESKSSCGGYSGRKECKSRAAILRRRNGILPANRCDKVTHRSPKEHSRRHAGGAFASVRSASITDVVPAEATSGSLPLLPRRGRFGRELDGRARSLVILPPEHHRRQN